MYNTQKLLMAWQSVWRTRCCPPVEILASDSGNDALEHHLEICPWCREAVRTGSFSSAAAIAEKLRALSGNAGIPGPAPGMIFFLSPSLGCWGRGGRYITPPAVLVLSRPHNSEITVAQIAGTGMFAGTGDIALGNGLLGYAQSWNIYRINTRDLLMLSADTGDRPVRSVTEAIMNQKENPHPEPGSIAWFYQELELETGRVISARSVSADSGIHTPFYMDTATLADDLERAGFSIPPDIDSLTSPDRLLLMAEPPETIMPLAAAGGGEHDGFEVTVLIFHVNQGRIIKIVTLPASISFSEYGDGIYRVAGKLSAPIPESMQGLKLHWLMLMETEHGPIQPLPGMSGSQGTMFWAAFGISATDLIRAGDIKIRITAHEE